MEGSVVSKRQVKREYKRLTILMDIILFSVLFGIIFLPLYLMDLKLIILFGLSFGLILGLFFLVFMIQSLRSKDKWIVILDFNYFHEGMFELILFTIIIGFEILAIIMAFVVIYTI